MNEIKNSSPQSGNFEVSRNLDSCQFNNFADSNCTKKSDNRQIKNVEDYLRHGKENAISTSDLVSLIGASSPRHLQQLIAERRGAGVLILSSSSKGGYFLPTEPTTPIDAEKRKNEIEEFIACLRSRALNTLKALKAFRRSVKIAEEQMSLFDRV